MKQKKFIDYYMKIAEVTAQLSYAVRLKVGAVLVRDNQIIGTGYNGMPSGWDNNCENKIYDAGSGGWLSPEEIFEQYPYEEHKPDANQVVRYNLKTKPEVLHAESNALMKVARSTESSMNATMFCTHAPCIECAKLIYQAGVTKLYYREQYRDNKGLEFLSKSGVDVTRHEV